MEEEQKIFALIPLANARLSTVLREVEEKYLEHVLSETGGNITQAAKLAGITRQAMSAKIKRYPDRKYSVTLR